MDHLKMYVLLNMGIFQPAMFVYQRVIAVLLVNFSESYPKYRLVNDSHEVNLDGVIDAEEFAEALLNRRCSGAAALGNRHIDDILGVIVYI